MRRPVKRLHRVNNSARRSLSAIGGEPLGNAHVRWQLNFVDRFGRRSTVQDGSYAVQPTRFGVTTVDDLLLTMPEENGLATVALWLVDGDGEIRSRNYVNVEVRGAASPVFEQSELGAVLRFAAGDFNDCSWPNPFAAPDKSKFSAGGSGWVDYVVPLPAELDTAAVGSLRLLFEAGARAGNSKVDWPQRTYGLNYPQTEPGKETPSDVVITINGMEVGTIDLPDDPADARGVLSHHHQIDPGSYGFLKDVVVAGDTLAAILQGATELHIRFTVPAGGNSNGFALFGETLGGYPVGPTVLLS